MRLRRARHRLGLEEDGLRGRGRGRGLARPTTPSASASPTLDEAAFLKLVGRA